MEDKKRLIDASEAIEKIKKAAAGMHLIHGIKAVDIEAVILFLGMLKPVDAVEVVHGRWEPHMEELEDGFGKTELVQTGMQCSECGDYSCCGGNFCKNCGAKMDGDRDG